MMKKRILITDATNPFVGPECDYLYRKMADGYEYRFSHHDPSWSSIRMFIEAVIDTLKCKHPGVLFSIDVRVGNVKINNITAPRQLIRINTRVITEAEFARQKYEISKGFIITSNEPPCKPSKWWWPF